MKIKLKDLLPLVFGDFAIFEWVDSKERVINKKLATNEIFKELIIQSYGEWTVEILKSNPYNQKLDIFLKEVKEN